MERSPCYDCPDKNYIGGCSVGCKKYADHQAEKAERKKKTEQQKAAEIVLIHGVRKYQNDKRRTRKR